MITKMTETNILCGDISIPKWRRQFSIEIIPNMTETYIPFGDIQIPIDRTLHLLLGHSNSNWKNSSVSKWFQTWQNLTSRICVGTFKFQLKNAVQYWTDFKDHRTLHPLWEHSNPKWKRQFSIEIISKMTEPYILCGDIQIPIDKTSHLLLGYSNSTEKDSSVLKWFQRWRTRTSFAVTFKSNWKRQFNIEKIWKITKLYILCGAIQNPTEKDSSLSKWLQRWQNITLFAGTFNFQLKKTLQYWNDYKDDRTLHSFWGHSNFDWKSSSVSKWLQRSQKFTTSVETFKFQQKKSSLVLKWFQRWQYHTFFVETIKFQLKNQFSIEMISRIKDLYILCWDIQFPTEKHRLLFKWLQRWQTLTFFVGAFKFQLKEAYIFCWDIQIPTGKKQFIIQMTSKITEPYIVWGTLKFQLEINSQVLEWFQRWQTPTSFVGTLKIQLKKTIQYRKGLKDRKTLHPLWGNSNPNWKRQFIIEMITKMTEPYILCGDIQIPTEKDSSVIKWFQIWRNLTSFVGTFKFQLKKTVQYWNDYKDNRTLHSLWGHLSSDWKNSSVSKWFQRSQHFTSSVGTFKFQLKKKTV